MTIDISIHTDVFCDDGLVGKSTHIVVDLVTEQVTHIGQNEGKHARVSGNESEEEIQLNCNI